MTASPGLSPTKQSPATGAGQGRLSFTACASILSPDQYAVTYPKKRAFTTSTDVSTVYFLPQEKTVNIADFLSGEYVTDEVNATQ